MRRLMMAGLFGLAVLSVCQAGAGTPLARGARQGAKLSDVDRFIVRRDACEHFSGEDPYDGRRAAFLARKIRETCTGLDAQGTALRRKYRGDPSVLTRLSSPEDGAAAAGLGY
jgi:hypothetical protein